MSGSSTDHRRERDSRNAAARNLANRYFGILFHCLQHRISYDEAKAFPTNHVRWLDSRRTCDVFPTWVSLRGSAFGRR